MMREKTLKCCLRNDSICRYEHALCIIMQKKTLRLSAHGFLSEADSIDDFKVNIY